MHINGEIFMKHYDDIKNKHIIAYSESLENQRVPKFFDSSEEAER